MIVKSIKIPQCFERIALKLRSSTVFGKAIQLIVAGKVINLTELSKVCFFTFDREY